MKEYIPPQSLGLPPRTIVRKIDNNTLAIVINRKSRIIMADGRKILEKAAIIKNVMSGKKIVVETTAPVCSKTLKFLKDNGIKLLHA